MVPVPGTGSIAAQLFERLLSHGTRVPIPGSIPSSAMAVIGICRYIVPGSVIIESH